MAEIDRNEREGLLTTIRARRKWYLGIYFLQMIGWLALVVANTLHSANYTDIASQRILDAAVMMSFIGQGTLITTVFLIDVLFDGSRYLIKKGTEFMGLLFDNFENKFVVRGREQGIELGIKQGLEQGEEQANARWSAWLTDNPEIKKLIDEGKVATPPESDEDPK